MMTSALQRESSPALPPLDAIDLRSLSPEQRAALSTVIALHVQPVGAPPTEVNQEIGDFRLTN
jgi:hypothetical protein